MVGTTSHLAASRSSRQFLKKESLDQSTAWLKKGKFSWENLVFDMFDAL